MPGVLIVRLGVVRVLCAVRLAAVMVIYVLSCRMCTRARWGGLGTAPLPGFRL